MIEDDRRLADMVADYLSEHALDVRTAETGADGMAAVEREHFDAVLLDVMLPDADGFELCRRIRRDSGVAVIMLTARGDETDRIVGLELGADDYLPKPFNPRELLARLRAVLRRGAHHTGDDDTLSFGALEIDAAAREVRRNGRRCDLTPYQFDIVLTLARDAGRVLSRDQLMERLRGGEAGPFDRSIDVHVSRIRSAIESDPKHPRHLLTVRGSGYVFAKARAIDDGAK